MNITLITTIISLIFCLKANAKNDEIILKHVADLPQWNTKEELTWLNPPHFRSTADGQPPTSRYSLKTLDTTFSPIFYYKTSLKLFGGWIAETTQDQQCLKTIFTLKKDSIFSKFEIKHNRQSGFFDRRLSCIGGRATVFNSVYLNSQFMAFNTSEPGWIFFDYTKGKFLPFVLATNPNHNSYLFVNHAGKVFVEIGLNPQGLTYSVKGERQSDGLREIKIDGISLEAPVNTTDLIEVKKIQNENKCAIEKQENRTCKQ